MTIAHEDRIDAFKTEARRLRAARETAGTPVSHSQALELVAAAQGARDWNTLVARPGGNRPLEVGDRVAGRYLGQPFTGLVRASALSGKPGWRQVELQFDHPVDVVSFESFSNFRSRVTAVVDEDGRSPQKTSDGRPQMVVARVGTGL